MKIKVKVEQRHIEHGEIKNCKRCPVSLAMYEATGKEYYVTQRTCFEKWEDKGIRLPAIVIDFIERFDQKIRVQPFEFDIDL